MTAQRMSQGSAPHGAAERGTAPAPAIPQGSRPCEWVGTVSVGAYCSFDRSQHEQEANAEYGHLRRLVAHALQIEDGGRHIQGNEDQQCLPSVPKVMKPLQRQCPRRPPDTDLQDRPKA